MNNTITKNNYDESIELLDDIIDIIQKWELNGKSNYDFINEDDKGYDEIKDDYDEYCKDMDEISELITSWEELHDKIFPTKTNDWENKCLERPFSINRIIELVERIEKLRIVNDEEVK